MREINGTSREKDLGGNSESRIHEHRHRQFSSIAVIDDAALRRQWNRPLLLVFRLLDESSVAEDLQINQASTDQRAPENEHDPQEVGRELRARVDSEPAIDTLRLVILTLAVFASRRTYAFFDPGKVHRSLASPKMTKAKSVRSDKHGGLKR